MTSVFVVCAAVGGTILVFQFAMTMIGLGGDAFDMDLDVPDDVDVGAGPDVGGGLDVDADFDGDVDFTHDGHIGSTWLFGVISFRTIVAALTFFGLAGLAAESMEARPLTAFLIALAAGAAAMYAVYRLMRFLSAMRSEGTARIERAVGKVADVYIPIPAKDQGTGKIQINLQGRTMEYLAMTDGDRLPSGAKVVVAEILSPSTVKVESIVDSERNSDA